MSKFLKKHPRLFATTNKAAGFSPSIVLYSGGNQWIWYGDSTKEFNFSYNKTFPDTSTKKIEVAVPDPSDAKYLELEDCDWTGALDVSIFDNLERLQIYGDSMTSVTLPSSSSAMNRIWLFSLPSITSLDLSGMTLGSGNMEFFGCGSLTSWTPPTVTTNCQYFTFNNCGSYSNTLDLSFMDNKCSGILNFHLCFLLTTVVMPISSSAFSSVKGNNCNLTGSVDGSGLTGAITNFWMYSNANLTEWLFGTNASVYGTINFSSSGLLTPDLSGLTGGATSYLFNSCPDLTSITFGTNTFATSNVYVYSCNLTGALDLSPLQNAGGEIRAYSNPLLTSVTVPTSATAITRYEIYSCNLTGNHNCSGLTGLGGIVNLNSNPNLTSITFPTSSETITRLEAAACNLTGVVDFSGLTGVSGIITFITNPLLTDLTLPTSTNVITGLALTGCSVGFIDVPASFTAVNDGITISVNSNSMTVAEVNEWLDSLDNSGWINGVLEIQNNSVPDGSSGGFDGTTAKANLIANGWTVTTD